MIKKYKKVIERDGYQFFIIVTLNVKYNRITNKTDLHEIKILGGKVSDIYCKNYSDVTSERLVKTLDLAVNTVNYYIDNGIEQSQNISDEEKKLIELGLEAL